MAKKTSVRKRPVAKTRVQAKLATNGHAANTQPVPTKPSQLSIGEATTLMYLETCAVDQCGRVSARRLNQDELRWAQRMAKIGFIGFGRICSRDCNSDGDHWVTMTPASWSLAQQLRRDRAARGLKNRDYQSTEEASLPLNTAAGQAEET